MPKNPNHKLPPRYEIYRELIDTIVNPDNLPIDVECKDEKEAKALQVQLYHLMARLVNYFKAEVKIIRPVMTRKGNKLIFSKHIVYTPKPFKIRRRELIVKEDNNE